MKRVEEICKELEQKQMEYTEQISDLNVLKKPNKDHDEVSKIQRSGKIKININRHKTNT